MQLITGGSLIGGDHDVVFVVEKTQALVIR
jgi:hypothetical protein